MRVYLMRHGDSIAGVPDSARPLSTKGINDIQQLAQLIAPLKLHVATIFHSEKLRTQQTAEIIASSIQSDEPMQSRSELSPLHSIDPIYDEIFHWDKDILLVGHMPFMGKLIAKLVVGQEKRDIVSFAPGCLICLEQINKDFWMINWMLNPELCVL